jgi:hypothetical protein
MIALTPGAPVIVRVEGNYFGLVRKALPRSCHTSPATGALVPFGGVHVAHVARSSRFGTSTVVCADACRASGTTIETAERRTRLR